MIVYTKNMKKATNLLLSCLVHNFFKN